MYETILMKVCQRLGALYVDDGGLQIAERRLLVLRNKTSFFKVFHDEARELAFVGEFFQLHQVLLRKVSGTL